MSAQPDQLRGLLLQSRLEYVRLHHGPAAIERVLEQQAEVRQLVEHHWQHLLRIDPEDGPCHRYQGNGHWQTLSTH